MKSDADKVSQRLNREHQQEQEQEQEQAPITGEEMEIIRLSHVSHLDDFENKHYMSG